MRKVAGGQGRSRLTPEHLLRYPCPRDMRLPIQALLLAPCLTLLSANIGADDNPLPADDEWQFLSFAKRHSQMTFLIHPVISERYQKFQDTEHPEITCRSCHGPEPERASYKMSNSTLDDLDPENVRALYLADAVLTPYQKFKRDNITPAMARLMGVAKYDPDSGLGFSCFGCHRRGTTVD
ncbi:MAG: hypothetical protein AAF384_06400 [Pseudomonadota bacterium]